MIKHCVNSDKLFFISDTHFGHANIIKLAVRPFKNIRDMDNKLVNNWNTIVPPDGVVYHLGDFGSRCSFDYLSNIRKKLNGKVHLILGNHDNINKAKMLNFDSISSMLELIVNDGGKAKHIIICHYPLLSYKGMYNKDYWHLFGHCHGNIQHPSLRAIDVSVENLNYQPIPYDAIKTIINNRINLINKFGEIND